MWDWRAYVRWNIAEGFHHRKKEKMQSFDYLRHRRPVSLESKIQKEIKRNHKRPKKTLTLDMARKKDAAHHTHKKGKWNINKCHNKRNLGNITREDNNKREKEWHISWHVKLTMGVRQGETTTSLIVAILNSNCKNPTLIILVIFIHRIVD